MPLLERVRGYALLQRGDRAAGRQALEASLAAGRTRRDDFEVAQTLLALIELARLESVAPPSEFVSESGTLFAKLKVRVPPAAPIAAL
jgi:hypothetical protein